LDCEQRFSKNAEAWVLRNIPRNHGEKFPIVDGLSAEEPLLADGGTKVCAGAKVRCVEMGKLVYFAMSIFWRGAVQAWESSLHSEAPDVHLCGHEEPIRQFLLGASPLSEDVRLTVYVCPNGSVLNAIFIPMDAQLPQCSRYLFYVSGLVFVLHFADKLALRFEATCAYHSPDKVIILSADFEKFIRDILRDQAKNRDSSRVQKVLEEIAKGRKRS
jgi:hypothetical protein